MADENTLIKFIAENSVTGAVGTAIIAFLYKAMRILKSDKKGDDLNNAERELREEMRNEIKELRCEYHELEQEKKKLLVDLSKLQEELARMRAELTQFKVLIRNYECEESNSPCPLLMFAKSHQFNSE